MLDNTDPKDWVGTIMKGTDLQNTINHSKKLKKRYVYDKNNVFENIHTFLKSSNS